MAHAFQKKARDDPCFAWLSCIQCCAREKAALTRHAHAREPVQETGANMWVAGPAASEILCITFPELPSGRSFFERFIEDHADFSILDMHSQPWFAHMLTSDGDLELWKTD